MEKSIDLENGYNLVVSGDIDLFDYERTIIEVWATKGKKAHIKIIKRKD